DLSNDLIECHPEFFSSAHNILAIDRAGECFVFHFLFYRGDIYLVDAFRRTNAKSIHEVDIAAVKKKMKGKAFARGDIYLVDAFRRTNACHRDDESAQLIDRIKCLFEWRLAGDIGITRVG